MILGSHVQVWFLQRRFHKDILLNPVLVLSFCPDLSSKHGQLGTATRELLFLLDGSSLAHKACGGTARAGLGVGWGSRSEVGCSTQTHVCTHTHVPSFSYSYGHLTLPDQELLSYIKLHSVTPNVKPKCHIHLQSHIYKCLSQILRVSLTLPGSHLQSVSHIQSHTHKASPRLLHPGPHFTHGVEKADNLASLPLYQCP